MTADRFDWLIQGAPTLFLVLDEAMTCRGLSGEWRGRLDPGMTEEPLTAERLFDEDENPDLLPDLARVARDHVPLVDVPAGVRLAEGVLPCRISAWCTAGDDTTPRYLFVAATDFTRFRETAAELSQLQSRHGLILEAAGEGVYGLDRDGRITFGNDAAARILGWQTRDILGRRAHDIHHHSRQDGSPYPHTECPIYAALQDGEVHTVDDEIFWHADGTAIPVEYTSTPILRDGRPDGAVVVFRDVSRRRELERQRNEAFDEIRRLKEQIEEERDYLRDEINVTLHFGEIIGESRSLKRTLAQVEAVAPTPANVLVLGESGVGKELIARAIHLRSNRRGRPLVKVNCASIPKDLFESEFFGHVQGAFTGAHRDRTGRLQLADGGTLFLDEVGEIPVSLQGKLLRALQEGEFERVGDDRTVSVDVRVVAATNRDLATEVKEGRFREDLYYRLSVFPIEVPSLRERGDDIALLARHFLDLICSDLGREPMALTRKHLSILQSHSWPGNIRELRNVIERAVISSPGSRLRLEPVPGGGRGEGSPLPSGGTRTEDGFLTEMEFRALEKANLAAALRHAGGRVWGEEGAAALLGIKPSTLTYRMKRFGIDREETPDRSSSPSR